MGWDGRSWLAQSGADPKGSYSELSGDWCTAATNCLAVGTYTNGTFYGQPLAERWSGSSWKQLSPTVPGGATYSELNTVACASSTWCMTVGDYGVLGASNPTLFGETWNGTSWTIADPQSPPTGSGRSNLKEVSCTSSSFCMVVGIDNANHALSETWNGSSWTISTPIVPTGATASQFSGVFCESSVSCLADGDSFNGTATVPLVEQWNGTTWTVDSVPSPSTFYAVLYDISCGSATSCIAVGSSQDTSGRYSSLAESWDGSTWTIQTTPTLTQNNDLSSIWCTSPTACTAVGSQLTPAFNQSVTLGERWDGTHWTVQVTPSPAQPPAGPPVTPAEEITINPSELAAFLCEVCAGDPVNTEDGTLSETYNDLSISGRGPHLSVSHTYSSFAASTDGPLGYGWTAPYEMSLSFDTSGNATVTQENGSQVTFANSGGIFSPPPRVVATLVKNSDGTYTFTRAKKEIFDFSSAGQPIDERDLNGLTTTFTYSGGQLATVKDPAGRTLTFTWTGSHITRIVDPIGRTITFTYDTAGDLTDVTDVAGGDTHFTYNSSHLLGSIRKPDQNPAIGGDGKVTTFTYDSRNRVKLQTDPLGRVTKFTYAGNASTPSGGATTVTAPNGSVTVDSYENGELVSTTKGYGTTSEATWTYSYDPATLGVTRVVDPNGDVTTSSYDSAGDLLQSVNPVGATTTDGYDALGDLLTSTDARNVETSYTYDAQGNLLTKTVPLLNTHGTVLADQTTTYHVCESASCTVGSNDYVEGDVESVTDPLGRATTDTYDANGDLSSVSDPAGDTTSYTYNGDGWRTSMVTPDGNVVGCSCAAKYMTTYSYVDAKTGATNEYGKPLVVTDPLGHATTYAYDVDQNLTSTTDASGHITTNAYDDDDEKISTTLPGGSTQMTSYWPDGSVKDQVDGAGNATQYVYDPLGHESTVTDPLGRTTHFVYDAMGHLLSKTEPTGAATKTTYDAAGQPTSISYSGGGQTPDVKDIKYNADAERIGLTDGSGTWKWTYDSLQRMTSATEGSNGTVRYRYDIANELTGLTYPSGQSVIRKFDSAGRLSSVTDWLKNTTHFGYDSSSNLTSETPPSTTGVVDRFAYDAANRLTGISDKKSATTFFAANYGLNADEQVASDSSTSAPNGPSYGYTALNQACYAGPTSSTSCPAPATGATSYQYNSAQDLTLNGQVAQGFDATGALCYSSPAPASGTCATPPTGATSYHYDTDGNRTAVTPSGSGSPQSLIYNDANQMIGFTKGTTSATYTYNSDGLRMSKAVTTSGVTTTTDYVWDDTASPAQLLEAGATAYVYGPGGVPLEQIAGTTALWLHHDQLGSTRVVTDSSGTVAGTYSYGVYGELASSTGSATVSLLYAGQYLDGESGLYYLRTRYYDPTTAQFTSVDPQEEQTRSPYNYASGNPLNAPDPTGLGSCPDGVAIPFTDLCLDNPLNFQQDAQNFDQNSQALQSVPVVGTVVQADPFYDDFRDGIYAAQGIPVAPGQIVGDLLGTAGAFVLPSAGDVMEALGFEGGSSVLAGNVAQWTNYTVGAVVQNNLQLIETFVGGTLGQEFFDHVLNPDSSGGDGGASGDFSALLNQLCAEL